MIDYYNAWKIYFTQWLAKWVRWYHIKRGENPYTKLEFRLRWNARILPTPLTNFHCLVCRRFTFHDQHKIEHPIGFDYWAGFKWMHPKWVYICKSCEKQSYENYEAYMIGI